LYRQFAEATGQIFPLLDLPLVLDIQFDLPRAPELLGAGDAFPNVRPPKPPTVPQDSETLGHSKSKACGGGGLKEKPNTDSLTKERESRRESKTNLFSLRVTDVSMFVS
jgi:hypothetical protein